MRALGSICDTTSTLCVTKRNSVFPDELATGGFKLLVSWMYNYYMLLLLSHLHVCCSTHITNLHVHILPHFQILKLLLYLSASKISLYVVKFIFTCHFHCQWVDNI